MLDHHEKMWGTKPTVAINLIGGKAINSLKLRAPN